MESNETERGLLWPLILLFVVCLFGGSIGIILAQGDDSVFDENVALLLMAVACGLAVLLYFPRLVAALGVANLEGVHKRTVNIEKAVTDMQASLQKIEQKLAKIP